MTSHDKLKAAIAQSRRTEIEFFQAAYIWRYKKVHNCVNDVCQYRIHGIIPSYVTEFVDHSGG